MDGANKVKSSLIPNNLALNIDNRSILLKVVSEVLENFIRVLKSFTVLFEILR